jgi:hypothetical protein
VPSRLAQLRPDVVLVEPRLRNVYVSVEVGEATFRRRVVAEIGPDVDLLTTSAVLEVPMRGHVRWRVCRDASRYCRDCNANCDSE